jgi:hypothetical protein
MLEYELIRQRTAELQAAAERAQLVAEARRAHRSEQLVGRFGRLVARRGATRPARAVRAGRTAAGEC